jgi:hypothetical protein
MKYNYKCVMAKNGNKMYYKNVRNKWKRISNKIGEKAQKGKRKYRMDEDNFLDTPEPKIEDYVNPENFGSLTDEQIKQLQEYNDIFFSKQNPFARQGDTGPSEEEIIREVRDRMRKRDGFRTFAQMPDDLVNKIAGNLNTEESSNLSQAIAFRDESGQARRYPLARQQQENTYNELLTQVGELNRQVDRLAREEDMMLVYNPRDPGRRVELELDGYRFNNLILPGREQEYGNLIYDKLTLQSTLNKLKEKYDPGEGSSGKL